MKKFTLKSGNKPMFKAMGSSPLHVHDGTTSTTTHNKDGSPKTAAPQHEVTRGEISDYQKRKEALLNKGFTQEDADWMIKHGGDIDPTPAPEHPKYEKKKKKSPAKHGDHKSKEYFKDSKHFMKHNREAMAKEDWVRGLVEKGKLNQPKPKLAKTLGEEKKKSKKSPTKQKAEHSKPQRTNWKDYGKGEGADIVKKSGLGPRETPGYTDLKTTEPGQLMSYDLLLNKIQTANTDYKVKTAQDTLKPKKKSPTKTAGHGGKRGHTHPKPKPPILKSMSEKDRVKHGLRLPKEGWSWVTLDGKPSEVKK